MRMDDCPNEIKMVEALRDTITCIRAGTRSGAGTPAWLHASEPGSLNEANGVKCVSDSLFSIAIPSVEAQVLAVCIHSAAHRPLICVRILCPLSIESRGGEEERRTALPGVDCTANTEHPCNATRTGLLQVQSSRRESSTRSQPASMGEATTVMTMDTSSTSVTNALADQQQHSTAAPDLKTLHHQAEEVHEHTETDADRPTTPHSITSTSISSDSDTASTPTQEAARPIFIETVTLHDEPLDDRALSSTSSSQPETPTGPRTPTTPHDPTRDSMASFALSDTSMDWNNLSTETVDDVLATPRVNGARKHLRKVSSLDILANKFAAPERPSTLFDTDGGEDTPGLPMSAIELGQSDKELDTWRRGSDASSLEYTHAHRPSTATLDSIDMLDQPTPTTDTGMSRNLSIDNRSSDSSGEDVQVDWKALDKNEEQEKEDKATQEGAEDDATAFLLARLEQENAKFAADPKASASKPLHRKTRAYSRPPSMAQLKKLVATSDAPSIRYSLASDTGMPSSPEEAPPMTELEFWVALVQDYPSTASRLPTLTTTKIRSGVPPPLRGVVWASMAGARDRDLEDAYEKLVYEKSPYEGIINKDVGRSFPGVELFRDADGEGQKMLGRVLKCFSLHDKDIGYCQGLGFLVGPLLMNMGERDAFCVLVR